MCIHILPNYNIWSNTIFDLMQCGRLGEWKKKSMDWLIDGQISAMYMSLQSHQIVVYFLQLLLNLKINTKCETMSWCSVVTMVLMGLCFAALQWTSHQMTCSFLFSKNNQQLSFWVILRRINWVTTKNYACWLKFGVILNNTPFEENHWKSVCFSGESHLSLLFILKANFYMTLLFVPQKNE